MLRPGNAGSFTASDHIAFLDDAFSQIPAPWHTDVLVTMDGAGASHDIVEHLTALNTFAAHGNRGRRVEYSIWANDHATAWDRLQTLHPGRLSPATVPTTSTTRPNPWKPAPTRAPSGPQPPQDHYPRRSRPDTLAIMKMWISVNDLGQWPFSGRRYRRIASG